LGRDVVMNHKIKELLIKLPVIIPMTLIIFLFLCFVIQILYTPVAWFFVLSPGYNKAKFTREINKDDRMEKLLYIKSNSASEGVWHIGIELKDGKKIGGRIQGSIFRFYELEMIDGYNIFQSSLHNNRVDNSKYFIYYLRGIPTSQLEELLNKSDDYFDNSLNKFINCYDEIKGLVEKIYIDPIPGAREGDNIGISEWGDEDELQKYIGYINKLYTQGNIRYRSKIYIELIND
jgi:hypothetical protein